MEEERVFLARPGQAKSRLFRQLRKTPPPPPSPPGVQCSLKSGSFYFYFYYFPFPSPSLHQPYFQNPSEDPSSIFHCCYHFSRTPWKYGIHSTVCGKSKWWLLFSLLDQWRFVPSVTCRVLLLLEDIVWYSRKVVVVQGWRKITEREKRGGTFFVRSSSAHIVKPMVAG